MRLRLLFICGAMNHTMWQVGAIRIPAGGEAGGKTPLPPPTAPALPGLPLPPPNGLLPVRSALQHPIGPSSQRWACKSVESYLHTNGRTDDETPGNHSSSPAGAPGQKLPWAATHSWPHSVLRDLGQVTAGLSLPWHMGCQPPYHTPEHPGSKNELADAK